jgi:hypothetical protein
VITAECVFHPGRYADQNLTTERKKEFMVCQECFDRFTNAHVVCKECGIPVMGIDNPEPKSKHHIHKRGCPRRKEIQNGRRTDRDDLDPSDSGGDYLDDGPLGSLEDSPDLDEGADLRFHFQP